jgi:copper chaperone CopZ
MSTLDLSLNDLACTGCIGKVKNRMKHCKGIEKVSILPESAMVKIDFDEKMIVSDEIIRIVTKLFFKTFD